MDKSQKMNQKKTFKMSLRENSRVKPKKLIEYDSDQEQKHIQSKSKKWWSRVDRKYFKDLTFTQLAQLKNLLYDNESMGPESKQQRLQSFFAGNIYSKNAKLFERRNLKVIFQNVTQNNETDEYCFVSYYFSLPGRDDPNQQYSMIQNSGDWSEPKKQAPFQHQNPQIEMDLESEGLHVYHMKSPVDEKDVCLFDEEEKKSINLIQNKSSNDMAFITECLQFDMIQGRYIGQQIDQQIKLWEQQLDKIQAYNENIWNNIKDSYDLNEEEQAHNPMYQKILNGYQIDEDQHQIQEYLKWQNLLLSFKYGFLDKTEEMLAQALESMWIKQNLGKDAGQRKKIFKSSTLEGLILAKSELLSIFQTDCKVCFHNYCSETNKVIYCDSCNQSFHESCYGLIDVDTDVQNKFYCDICSESERRGLKKPRSHVLGVNKSSSKSTMACQICFIEFTPLKMIDDHFYHPSCLLMNNLVKPQVGKIQLKQQYSHKIIRQLVAQSSEQMKNCRYCCQNSTKGVRIQCQYPQCRKAFHTICGYLNAAVLNFSRQESELRVQAFCPDHFLERDAHRQAYLRRFFCNYRSTSDISEVEFLQIYHEELKDYQNYQRFPQLYLRSKRQDKKFKREVQKFDTKQSSSNISQSQTFAAETAHICISQDSEDHKITNTSQKINIQKEEVFESDEQYLGSSKKKDTKKIKKMDSEREMRHRKTRQYQNDQNARTDNNNKLHSV